MNTKKRTILPHQSYDTTPTEIYTVRTNNELMNVSHISSNQLKNENIRYDEINGTVEIGILNKSTFTIPVNLFNELRSDRHKRRINKLRAVLKVFLIEINNIGNCNDEFISLYMPIEDIFQKMNITPSTKKQKFDWKNDIFNCLFKLSNIIYKGYAHNGNEYFSPIIAAVEKDRNGFKIKVYKKMIDSLTLLSTFTSASIDCKNIALNSNSLPMYDYLQHRYTMVRNIQKNTHNIVKVKNLLRYSLTIPSIEQVRKEDRHLRQRIIEPFETALDAISKMEGVQFHWEYCKPKSEPLTDKEIENMYTNINIWENMYISFSIPTLEEVVKNKRKKH